MKDFKIKREIGINVKYLRHKEGKKKNPQTVETIMRDSEVANLEEILRVC